MNKYIKTFENLNSDKQEFSDYEILYETPEKNKRHAIVMYDSTVNKPFLVYQLNIETSEYELFSGEDELDFAIGVANSLVENY